MAPKRDKILGKKCTELRNGNGRKHKAKNSGLQTWRDPVGRGRRGGNKLRTLSLHGQPTVPPTSKSILCLTRNKRFRADSSENYQSEHGNEKCNCAPPNKRGSGSAEVAPRTGMLHRRISSEDVVTDYLTAELDRVSSFVVESALRLGKERGVVVPEKGRGEIYQIASPKMSEEKKRAKKIRFKIPEGTLGYEDAKKAMWRRGKPGKVKGDIVPVKAVPTRYPTAYRRNSLESPSDSIKAIMPVLERLKKDDNVIESELDLRTISRYLKEESEKARKGKKRSKSCQKKRTKAEEENESKLELTTRSDSNHRKSRPKCDGRCSK